MNLQKGGHLVRVLQLIIGCFVVGVCGEDARAQSLGGTLVGTVADASRAGVSGAVVEITAGGPRLSFTTDRDGQFRFPDLPPDLYRLSVWKQGFRPVRRTGLLLRGGETLSFVVTLELEDLQQILDVHARRIATGSRVSFTSDELATIPTPRHVVGVLPLVPGVVSVGIDVGGSRSHQQPQFVFRGSRMLDTAWTIDGVVVTDRQTGSPLSFYDLDAFDEIQFSTPATDIARPGSGLGVSMVVRSGTDQLHSTARGYFTGAALQASNLREEMQGAPYFLTPDRADHTRQFAEYGLDVGGPLRRNRAWVWASAAHQDVRVVRQGGDLERTVLTPRTMKVNWQATPSDRLNVLWMDNGLNRFGINGSPLRAAGTARQNQSALYADNPFHGLWKVEDHRAIRQALFISARYAYYNTGYQNVSIGPGAAGISPRLAEAFGGTSSQWSVRPQHTLSADGTHFGRLRGRANEISFGGTWQRVEMYQTTRWPGDAIVAYDNSPADQRARIYREQRSGNRLLLVGAYLADRWRTDRLTLDAGLRVDHQRAEALPSSPQANPAFPDLVPALHFRGHTAGTWSNVSPRAAVTYALDSGGRTLLRGGVARYAAQLVMGVAAQSNPAHLNAWIEFPWEDGNGDGLAQREEVRTDRPYVAFDGIDPQNTSAPVAIDAVDPGVPTRTTTELSLALERQLTTHAKFEVGYQYTRETGWPYTPWQGVGPDDYQLLRVVPAMLPGAADVYIPVYAPDATRVLANGAGRVITGRPGYYSTYHGVNASFVKRLAQRWMLQLSGGVNNPRSFYRQTVPVNSLGNPTRLDGSTGGPITAPMDPLVNGGQLAPAATATGGGGSVFLNATWQVGAGGAYLLPKGFDVAGSLVGRQGTPSPYVIRQPLGLDGSRAVLASPAIDSVRLDDVWNLDLRLSKRVEYRRFTLRLFGDLFNALNGNAALVRERNLASASVNRVDMIVSPRILRVGLRISY